MSKKSLYWIYPQDGGCTYHRILQPARFLHEYFEEEWEFSVGPNSPPGHDVYLFNGLPSEGNTLLEVASMKRRGAKFIWSVDDDWLTIPDWNPAKPSERGLAAYEIMKLLADHIIVSTPYLAGTFDDMCHKVHVCPNLLDLTRFPNMPMREFEEGGEKKATYDIKVSVPVRIAWVGSETHLGDMEEMTDTLDKFLDQHGGVRAILIYQGMAPNGRLWRKYGHRCLFHQPMTTFASYQSILNSIEPHVYLAPLAHVPFNASKSNLRIMEGWALGAAPLASEWGEYKCIRNGVDGRLVLSPDAWYSALTRLVTDHEMRASMAAHGRRRVEKEYSWNNSNCHKPWIEALSKILGD